MTDSQHLGPQLVDLALATGQFSSTEVRMVGGMLVDPEDHRRRQRALRSIIADIDPNHKLSP